MAGPSRFSFVVVGIISLLFGGFIILTILNGTAWNSENWYLFFWIIGGPILVAFGILATIDGLLGTDLVSRG
jgi:hypothetical protein